MTPNTATIPAIADQAVILNYVAWATLLMDPPPPSADATLAEVVVYIRALAAAVDRHRRLLIALHAGHTGCA